jgi:arginyl-tRNA synthetase
MVDLPSGKMKSREGTVVDADDLMDEMIQTAQSHTEALGKVDDFTTEEAQELYRTLGLGALKYFLLKVDPRKKMLFNPLESIEFQGNTGPFIQYTHARISAIVRRANELKIDFNSDLVENISLAETEADLIYLISDYPNRIALAAQDYSPAVIAQYIFDLAKEYNKFYAELSIFNEDNQDLVKSRIKLSAQVAKTIKSAMDLLGINVPDRM